MWDFRFGHDTTGGGEGGWFSDRVEASVLVLDLESRLRFRSRLFTSRSIHPVLAFL